MISSVVMVLKIIDGSYSRFVGNLDFGYCFGNMLLF